MAYASITRYHPIFKFVPVGGISKVAFTLDINGPPYQMDRLVTDDASSVLSPIGYDAEAKRIYLVIVSLYNWQEFGCSLISRRVDTGEEAEFTSGLATKSFLTGTDRAAVLDVILAATDHLICWTRPHTFERITSDANLTPGAMAKHEAIGRVFTRNGYRVIEEPGFHGQRVWRVSLS